jgi:hypothetical protein
VIFTSPPHLIGLSHDENKRYLSQRKNEALQEKLLSRLPRIRQQKTRLPKGVPMRDTWTLQTITFKLNWERIKTEKTCIGPHGPVFTSKRHRITGLRVYPALRLTVIWREQLKKGKQ